MKLCISVLPCWIQGHYKKNSCRTSTRVSFTKAAWKLFSLDAMRQMPAFLLAIRQWKGTTATDSVLSVLLFYPTSQFWARNNEGTTGVKPGLFSSVEFISAPSIFLSFRELQKQSQSRETLSHPQKGFYPSEDKFYYIASQSILLSLIC